MLTCRHELDTEGCWYLSLETDVRISLVLINLKDECKVSQQFPDLTKGEVPNCIAKFKKKDMVKCG